MAYDTEILAYLTQKLKPLQPIDLGIKNSRFLKSYTEKDARYFAHLLEECLPNDIEQIKEAYHNRDFSLLYQRISRLYDALHFCPTPRLRQALLRDKPIYSNELEKRHVLVF
ncbi:hypothetical protein YTPLAS21_21400 [Candidatus Nitrosocosmicus sp.]|nr:hypothetical protein YTPLAS21_21400 [Candidatus Nitrosocosmicus sp.]